MIKEKILNCYIDESGDFGKICKEDPFYYVAIVFHEQNIDILQNIRALDEHIKNLGFPIHAIHTGPLIRREEFYKNDERKVRRSLFNALYHFARKLNIRYICPKISKYDIDDFNDISMVDKLSKVITAELKNNYDYIAGFDKLVIYYDNGQKQLTKIIASVFNAIFLNVEFCKVPPIDYKLSQVADLVCTMELVADKAASNNMSTSEIKFFGSSRDFTKNLYKQFSQKKLR